jgi:transposase
MRRRPPHLIELSNDETAYLVDLVRDGRTEQRVARRARLLLAMVSPETVVQQLADQLELSRNAIRYMSRRYEEIGVEAVFDAPRSGRPREISPPGTGGD